MAQNTPRCQWNRHRYELRRVSLAGLPAAETLIARRQRLLDTTTTEVASDETQNSEGDGAARAPPLYIRGWLGKRYRTPHHGQRPRPADGDHGLGLRRLEWGTVPIATSCVGLDSIMPRRPRMEWERLLSGYLSFLATPLVLQRIFYRRSRSNASRFFRCERYAR
jgi:hypothetical protein